jgi:hypothetical protein
LLPLSAKTHARAREKFPLVSIFFFWNADSRLRSTTYTLQTISSTKTTTMRLAATLLLLAMTTWPKLLTSTSLILILLDAFAAAFARVD